jgi:hypothetical protein
MFHLQIYSILKANKQYIYHFDISILLIVTNRSYNYIFFFQTESKIHINTFNMKQSVK